MESNGVLYARDWAELERGTFLTRDFIVEMANTPIQLSDYALVKLNVTSAMIRRNSHVQLPAPKEKAASSRSR